MALTPNTETERENEPDLQQTGVRWQERDRGIVELVSEHPATAEQVARLYFSSGTPGKPETSRKKANRRLNRLARRRKIRAIGLVLLKGTGRPQIVYGGRKIKLGMLEHEVLITELRLHFFPHPFERSVPIGKTTADALLFKDQTKFWIELDTNRMDQRQMRAKWLRYGNCQDFILIVCQSEKRLKRLKESAQQVKHIALFTTMNRLKLGRDKPWEDCEGKATNV